MTKKPKKKPVPIVELSLIQKLEEYASKQKYEEEKPKKLIVDEITMFSEEPICIDE